MSQIDLNALRAHVHRVQQEREQSGASQADQDTAVSVDRNAKISLGTRGAGNRELSTVPVEKFAGFDLVTNRRVAATKMPQNTIEVTGPAAGPMGIGWAFTVTTELSDSYTILIAYDGQYYQGYVLEPELEKHYKSPHRYHLFENEGADSDQNRICFGQSYNGGMPTLESAYAKAVIWANGFSVAKQGHTFPWNYDQ